MNHLARKFHRLPLAAFAIAAAAWSTWVAAEDRPAPQPIAEFSPAAAPGAPNVILVLLDDVGFSASSTFGGPVPTPNYEEIANQGLRYNRFHTTAMCSPTRASLLTGRNHHRVEMGGIVNLAFGQAGYTSVIPQSAATIGRVLKLNGYDTAWFGKNHLTPDWEITPTGPFDRWPGGFGFDYFYGFMGGATDQYSPDLVINRRFVDPPDDKDYILDKGLADQTIAWLRSQAATDPDKPFFVYLAPGTAHVPLQAPEEWVKRFAGAFNEGWDVVRRKTFERQKRLGLVPGDTVLTPRPESLPAWESLDEKQRAVAARLMEVFAAQLAHFDYQFGRILAEVERLGDWENTLVIYIDGDNGPDAMAGIYGSIVGGLNGATSSGDVMFDRMDQIGGPGLFPGLPAGWAWATATPFRYTKTIASHLGGTRDGMVVSWPARIRDAGAIRSQFLHVVDVAPTIYDAAGIVPPDSVDGIEQMSFDGRSFVDTFSDTESVPLRTSQYFELLGNRAYYRDGWMASSTPPAAQWEKKPRPAASEYDWELYYLETDYSQANNLATREPAKLAELKAEFQTIARENNVLPLDNNAPRRLRMTSLRPYITHGRKRFEYARSDEYLPNAAFPNIRNKGWSLRVRFSVNEENSSGTLITQGGQEAGWGLFLFDGVPTFTYKFSDMPGEKWTLVSASQLPAGWHEAHVRMDPDSSAPGAGAQVAMTIDGGAVITGRVDRTVPNAFPFSDGVGIGRDFYTTLGDEYAVPFRFAGEIESVVVELDDGE